MSEYGIYISHGKGLSVRMRVAVRTNLKGNQTIFEVEEVRVVVVHQFMVRVGGDGIREKEVYLPEREREREEELYPLDPLEVAREEEEVYSLKVARCEQLHCLFA